MRKMSFTSRDTARAADIFNDGAGRQGLLALADPGRLDLGRRLHARLPRHGEVRHDRRGGRHRRLDRRHGFLRGPGLQALPGRRARVDDNVLRENYIDRIYDTYIDEEELQTCDHTIYEIANSLEPRPYSLARVHLGDGQVAGGGQRQEARQPDPDRLRGRRADLLPGLRRHARRASAW